MAASMWELCGRTPRNAGVPEMAEYKHGSMNVTYNEKLFAGFVKMSVWVCVIAIFVLLFLAVFNS